MEIALKTSLNCFIVSLGDEFYPATVAPSNRESKAQKAKSPHGLYRPKG